MLPAHAPEDLRLSDPRDGVKPWPNALSASPAIEPTAFRRASVHRTNVQVIADCRLTVHYADSYRRAAVYVDKILKGPSLLTFRWSSRRSSELMINLMTAKALGLTIPQSEHPKKERPMHFILFVPIGLIAGALAGRVVGG